MVIRGRVTRLSDGRVEVEAFDVPDIVDDHLCGAIRMLPFRDGRPLLGREGAEGRLAMLTATLLRQEVRRPEELPEILPALIARGRMTASPPRPHVVHPVPADRRPSLASDELADPIAVAGSCVGVVIVTGQRILAPGC